MNGYPRTIKQLIETTYGPGGAGFALGTIGGLVAKSDDALTSTDTGVVNPLYGKLIWSWLNKEANVFSLLAKKPWVRSGFRVATTARANRVLGVDEEGELPAADHEERLPVLNQLAMLMTKFNVTLKGQELSEIEDGIDAWPTERKEQGLDHTKGINELLMADADAAVTTEATSDAKGNTLESIDRMISSGAEEAHAGATKGTGWFDVYAGAGDRDTGTDFDAVVDENDSVLRPLTLSMLNDLLVTTRANGANRARQYFLTGEDTQNEWSDLLSPQGRWEEKRVTKTMNGVKQVPGTDVGFMVNAYKGVPIFTTVDCPDDGGISRIYLIDQDHAYIKIRLPTLYLETKFTGDMLLLNGLKRLGAFLTTGQLEFTRFNTMGKIADLE